MGSFRTRVKWCFFVVVGLCSTPALYAQDETVPDETVPEAEVPGVLDAPSGQEEEAIPPTMSIGTENGGGPGTGGILGDLQFGPALSLGFPHFVNYGLDVMWKDQISGGFHTGSLEQEIQDVKLGISNWDVRARWHPMRGSFFIGLAYGSQTLEVEAKKKVDDGAGQEVSTTLKMDVDTTYTTPHIGWMAVYPTGLVLGFEIGYQLANSSSAGKLKASYPAGTSPDDSKEYKDLVKDVEDAAETFGKKSLPYLTLLKIGWMF